MKDRKIIHRDLKPANIFLNSFNILKIGDYGLAKSLNRTTQMAATQCGTLLYMAPELLNGKEYSHGADVWAMGCILYEMITLQQTFNSLSDIILVKYKPIPVGLHPRTARIVSQILIVEHSKRPTAQHISDCVCHLSSHQGNQGQQQKLVQLQQQAAKIKSTWNWDHTVFVEDLLLASSLVQAGLLTSAKGMKLSGMWLDGVNIRGEEISQLTLPTFDGEVVLRSLSGDISQLLPLISCQKLRIRYTYLRRNDTESLVKCLYTNVSELVLHNGSTVDISVLCQYDGTGKCENVECYFGSYERYRGQVTQWAHNMGWKVDDRGSWPGITITRK